MWEINQLLFATVKRVIDQFLDVGIEDFELNLDGLYVDDNELKDLVGIYDSSNEATSNDMVRVEYTYDIDIYEKSPGDCVRFMRKLIFVYRINDENGKRYYTIYYVKGFHDKVHVSCNEP